MEPKDAEMVTGLPVPIKGSDLALIDDRGRDFSGYQGVATVSLNPDQIEKLKQELPLEAHDILPTGEVYVPQVHYRRLLNGVFGPGSWALVPRGGFTMQGNTICREYALVGPGGRFISEAIGEAEYQPNNPRMSYASACEAAKSNALTRCCKDIGIASECWDKRFCEQFIKEHCAKVFRKNQTKPQWRRKDAEPWFDETGEAGNGGGGDHAHGERQQQSISGKPACPACHSAAKVIVAKYRDKRTGVEKPWYCLTCKETWGDSTKSVASADEPWTGDEDEAGGQM